MDCDPRNLTPAIAREMAIAENKQLYAEAMAKVLERAKDGWFCADIKCESRPMADRLARALIIAGWDAGSVRFGSPNMVKVEW